MIRIVMILAMVMIMITMVMVVGIIPIVVTMIMATITSKVAYLREIDLHTVNFAFDTLPPSVLNIWSVRENGNSTGKNGCC